MHENVGIYPGVYLMQEHIFLMNLLDEGMLAMAQFDAETKTGMKSLYHLLR